MLASAADGGKTGGLENIHMVTADGIGPVAPGLHNFSGPEISAGKC